jgi:hypothetical protein
MSEEKQDFDLSYKFIITVLIVIASIAVVYGLTSEFKECRVAVWHVNDPGNNAAFYVDQTSRVDIDGNACLGLKQQCERHPFCEYKEKDKVNTCDCYTGNWPG